LATLNPKAKTKMRYHLTFFWNSVRVFLGGRGIFNEFYYTLLKSTNVTWSYGLKSLFHAEMHIRKSWIEVFTFPRKLRQSAVNV